MFDHCIKLELETHSPEWYEFRTTGFGEYQGGIGGSEISKLLGLDDYRPVAAEIYHHKVGTEKVKRFDNLPMLMGRILERHIMELWQCHEGGDDDTISVSTDEDDREDLLQAEEEDKRIMFEAIERVKQQQDQ